MIKLSLERINAKSPYEVREAGSGYEFHTEGGILYRIRFLAENPIDWLKAAEKRQQDWQQEVKKRWAEKKQSTIVAAV